MIADINQILTQNKTDWKSAEERIRVAQGALGAVPANVDQIGSDTVESTNAVRPFEADELSESSSSDSDSDSD